MPYKQIIGNGNAYAYTHCLSPTTAPTQNTHMEWHKSPHVVILKTQRRGGKSSSGDTKDDRAGEDSKKENA